MHIFGYIATGFLIVCILLAATKSLSAGSPASIVIAMADVAQVVAPDAMQSSRQPSPGPILQQQNQADRALERLQDRAEEQEDLLNILD
jgi:ABC-type transport system involved in cytochrome bd biosynthesis fused ATPase/permease subunit